MTTSDAPTRLPIRFLPDLFDQYLKHEQLIRDRLGKAKMLKCQAAAKSLIENNKMSRKALHVALQELVDNPTEKLLALLQAKQLLLSNESKAQSPAYQYNQAHQLSIVRLLEYAADQIMLTQAPIVLKEMGLDTLLPFFQPPAFQPPSATPTAHLNTLLAGIAAQQGNMKGILSVINTFINEQPELLKQLQVAKDNQIEVLKALLTTTVTHIQTQRKQAAGGAALASHHSTINALSNLLSLTSLVQEYFTDMKDNLTISLAAAENLVIQEVASMSDAASYKPASLQALLKNLRCADERTKIAVINRVTAVVSALSNAFFIDADERASLGVRLREQLNSLVRAEDRFHQFAHRRL